jgi:hypothetical protein
MQSALTTLFNIVIWIFVPAILILLINYIYNLSKRIDDRRHKSSTRAGFWAGFMLFVIAFIYQMSIFIQTGFPDTEIYQGFNLFLAIIGGAIVFLGLFGRKVTSPELSGWLILIVSFFAFYSLLHYLFIRTFNETLLSLILGLTFGALTHFAFSPSSFKEFLRGS